METARKVTVTCLFQLIIVADEFQIWPHIADEVIKRLPLRDVPWTPPSPRYSAKTLSVVDIEMKRFNAEIFPKTASIHSTSPLFLHLYLINCEDIEIYRNFVRKQIMDWLNIVGNKKNQEWLIVHVSNQESKKTRFLGTVQSSVFEKVRNDFAMKQERCVQVKINSSDTKDQETWSELMGKIKELILLSYNNQLLQFDDDARRLDAQRLLPGWNYCQYFLVKESIALVHEFMGQFDEALVVYDELEAHFFQTLSEQGAPWFPRFGGNDPDDDSEDVLHVTRKPYRDLIMNSQITIFDFRIYLFTRQIHILFKLNSAPEIFSRSKIFINSFAKTLHQYDCSLKPLFCESWVYSACMNVIRNVEETFAVSNDSLNDLYQGYKGDLLHLARMQLDVIGVAIGLLPASYNTTIGPFQLRKAKVPAGADASLRKDRESLVSNISNIELKSALLNEESFDESYLNLTGKVLKAFELAKRTKLIWILRHDLATLYFNRLKYPLAVAELKQILNKYSQDGWNIIDNEILKKLVICYSEMQDYTQLCLSYMKLLSLPQLLEKEYLTQISNEFIQLLQSNTCGLVKREMEPLFRIELGTLNNRITNEDGLELAISLNSVISLPIKVEKITVRLVNEDGQSVELKCTDTLINKGVQQLLLIGDTGYPGTYYAESYSINLTSQVLLFSLVKKSKKSFKILDHSSFLRLKLGISDNSAYSETINAIKFTIDTRQYQFESEGLMQVTSLTGLQFQLGSSIEFSVLDISHASPVKREFKVNTRDSYIVLPSTSSTRSIIEFELPVLVSQEAKLLNQHKIKTNIQFNANGRQLVFVSTDQISLRVPLTIKHSTRNLPNGNSLIQLLCLNEKTAEYSTAIRAVNTSNSPSIELIGGLKPALLYPGQSMGLMYKVLGSESATVNIGYCFIDDQIQEWAIQRLDEKIASFKLETYSNFILKFIQKALGKADLLQFLIQKKPLLSNSLVDSLDHESIAELIREFIDELNSLNVTKLEPLYTTLMYQIQIPKKPDSMVMATMNIKQDQLTVGQLIDFELELASDKKVKCSISLEFNQDQWLVNGFLLQNLELNRKSTLVTGSLLPLKAGVVAYPQLKLKTSENIGFYYKNQAMTLQIKPSSTSWKYFFQNS